ncbi:prenyltransferase/squalene oxidase repeat-containing protein [Thermococcus peptonophilus]|uniref:Squalene cyclase C-terminal domain-containing protein n=1 Tax=Thermococcus peptonophilus TaxID=53952 RepID=A0A142CVU7_9EURY|nr:prenyltransferase/squalene oxidase repeat-containing protein [Thermococcus peptonophilus]AMQ18899.1 hypothetical protein A0127_06800 [Thermococcus peptonophilus]
MKKVLATILIVGFMLSLISSPLVVSAEIRPYVYEPTVPDTAFAIIALYKMGDYDKVLEGCEWLMAIRTPFDSWGYAYGEDHEAKYTAMAIMALIRGESIANGRYRDVINSAAYWLIYKQKADGSWNDYLDAAMAAIALRELLKSKYVEENMTGLEEQLREGLNRALGWLQVNEPENDVERIFRDIALGDKDDLEKLTVEGELKAYKAFALAYLGEKVSLEGNFFSPMAVAMALYATGNEKYREELLNMEHFGFWGKLHYRVLDLLDVSQITGFGELREIACPYLDKIPATEEWQKAVYAHYFVLCSKEPELPENYSALLPWQVAEVARIKALLGKPYNDAVGYLISTSNNGTWKDFYNTAYVVWVLKSLNVSYDYEKSLHYLSANLTWMLNEKNPKTGEPLYYSIPTYYFSQAAIVFSQFGMSKELNETLKVLRERQYPNGAFAYTHQSVTGITTTARVVWNLEIAGLTNTELYRKGVDFLRKVLYAEIPEVKPEMANTTFLMVKDGRYVGNTTGRVNPTGLDGYVAIYPSKNPLMIKAVAVEGFRAESPWRTGNTKYVVIVLVVGALFLAMYGIIWFENRRKK